MGGSERIGNIFFPNATTCSYELSWFPGETVADFWGWDARGARLRCPDDVSGDMQEDEIPGGALSLNSTNYPDHGHHGNLSLQGKIPMVEPGIEPGDLMISSQRLWPLDHEAGLETELKQCK